MQPKETGDLTLCDCNPEEAFWMNHGKIIRNIYELVDALKFCTYEQFIYHINMDHEKNDFAIWIREVLGDVELADSLKYCTNKDKYIDILEQRIKELENSMN